MKDDVVLADEVDEAGVLALPVALPRLGLAHLRGPLAGRRDVADRRVAPDVEDLALGVDAGLRRDVRGHRHAPRQIAGHRAVAEAAGHPRSDLARHVGLPVLLGLEPRLEPGLERAERREPVRRLAGLGRRVAQGALRLDQLERAQRGATLLALIAVGVRVLAVRAGAHHEAIGEEHLRLRIVELRLRLDDEVAGDLPEEVLARLVVDRRAGAAVVIEAHPDRGEVPLGHRVVLVDDLLGRDAERHRELHDRGAVLVRAADEDDVAALEAVVADEDVGGQVRAREVAEVDRAVRVGQRRRDQDALVLGRGFLGHGRRNVAQGAPRASRVSSFVDRMQAIA